MAAVRKCLPAGTAILLLTLALTADAAAPDCTRRAAAAPALARLQNVMATGRFVAYQPTSLQVVNGRLTQADDPSIRMDLETLRHHFDGLITYRADHGTERIADIAASLGYRALIIGVWDVNDQQELSQALLAAARQPQLVVGLSLGNERVFAGQVTFEALAKLLQNLRRRAPQLALTTTEPFAWLLRPQAAAIFAASDFTLVNIHPIFESWFHDAPDRNAAQFVVNVVDRLATVACGPILVKETGVPTAPAAAGYTPARQAGFYDALQQGFTPSNSRAFAYFSAFDAPWRANDVSPVAGQHPEEAHWGLYDERRVPKPAVQTITPLARLPGP